MLLTERRPGAQHRETKASINPFEEQPNRITEYTAREIATLQSRLDKQLGPEYISTRPGAGGGKVHYLAAEKVINLANEIFGFNGWSSAIQNVQVDFVDENATNGKISLGLSTIVRVTLKDGTYHEDIGYGQIENCKGKAAAFEKAKKEAATDALKRALRNFGNVLGNCLYDKDFLSRVTKIKVAPSRWDAENLHRHADFAPVKKETLPTEQHVHQDRPSRTTSVRSARSGGTEFGEDEFGGNLFDDMDFSHPDEVHLDDSVAGDEPETLQNGHTPSRQQIARTTSVPVVNGNNRSGVQTSHLDGPVNGSVRSAQQNVNGNKSHQAGVAMAPPQAAQSTEAHVTAFSRPQIQSSRTMPNVNRQAQEEALADKSRPLPQSAMNNAKHLTPPDGPNETAAQGGGSSTGDSSLPPPTEGFVTAKGAWTPTAQPFDPHFESPSIRRTSGVPQKSEPVLRKAIGAATPAAPAANGGQTAPSAAPNFINPAADTHRRIGMPGGGVPSPMGNRGAYKPHTSIKRPAQADTTNTRPPLADLSNNRQTDGPGDSKRPKVEVAAAQEPTKETSKT